MQSGISASQELHDAFQTLVSDESQFGLLAVIEKEKLIPTTVLHSSSSSTTSSDDAFSANLSLLPAHLSPTQALYLVLRRYASSPAAVATADPFIAVTYVPDAAPVRQKMLFASTRLTLARELGIERFRETMLVTTAAELTAAGFRRHDEHVRLAAPLTAEEEALAEVKRREAEEGLGMSARRAHVEGSGGGVGGGPGTGFSVEPDAMEALAALAGAREGDANLVQLKIDPKREVVLLDSVTTATAAALGASICATEPRYSFYVYTPPTVVVGGGDADDEKRAKSHNIFVYSCPAASKLNVRMMYALSRRGMTGRAEAEAGLVVERKLEVTDPDEVTEELLRDEFQPKVETKKAFSRPKRPGRT